MRRLLDVPAPRALGWGAWKAPTWDGDGSPGGSLDRRHALRQMVHRLEH